MPSFNYVAKDQQGKTLQGVMEAATQQEAVQRLRKDNLFIIQISNNSVIQQHTKANAPAKRGHVSLKDKLFFTKQFYIMLKAGLGMTTCLDNLFNQTANPYFRQIISEIRKDVESGKTLSEALEKHPKSFDRMMVHMVEAGEASGKLDVSFSRMNDYYERDFKLRKEVKGAMVYPAVIAVVATAAVIILMTVVMPMFASIFAGAGRELPGLTKFLMAISDLMRAYWYLIPVIPVAGFFGYRAVRQNPKGSAFLDKLWLKVPIFGELLRRLAVARFTRTLATLLDSGVPILQSLEIVQRTVNNAVMAASVRAATLSVSRGTGLAKPLADSDIFPIMVSQMISIGEETGDLAHMLNEVAEYYDKEVGYAVENLTAMIEPAVIVVMGVIVGVIVTAIYLPMFDISSGATLN